MLGDGERGWMVNLIHAGLTETHDRGVGEAVKDATQRGDTVEILGLHQLLNKLCIEQCSDHILKHCGIE